MKFTLLRLTALSLVAGASVHADEPSVGLRGSETIRFVDETEPGRCVNTGPRRTREAQIVVCLGLDGGFTEAFSCTKANNICCQPGGILDPEWGECTWRLRYGEEEERTEAEDADDEPSEDDVDADVADEFEAVGGNQCTPAPQLAGGERRSMSMSQACRINNQSTGKTVPYTCSSNPGYACCQPGTASKVKTSNVGKCKRAPGGEVEEDDFEEVGGNQCTPAPQLAGGERGSMSMSQACRISNQSTGKTVPYTCSSNPGYACCQSGTASKVKTSNVGKCKRAPGGEVEEDDFDEVGGNQCTPAPQLASSNRGGMPMSQACRVNFGSKGMTAPYTCSKSPGFACCHPGTASKVKTSNVGKCAVVPGGYEKDMFAAES